MASSSAQQNGAGDSDAVAATASAPDAAADDDEEDEDIAGAPKRKAKKKRSRFFHDEADESDDGEGDEGNKKKKGKTDSDDEENDENEYQEDGFVVADNADDEDDNDEEDDGLDTSSEEEEEEGRLKKNKRKKTTDLDDLDDDDLEIAGFAKTEPEPAPAAPAGTGLDSSDDEDGEQTKTAKSTKELEQQLFGPDDGGTKDGQAGASGDGGAASARKPSGYDNGYDSMDDFIERDDDEPSDDEPYGGEKRPGPAMNMGNQEDSLNFRDAVAIFGMDLDDLDLGYEDEDAAGFGDVDDEDGDAQRMSAAERALRKRYDPAVLKRNYVTTQDDRVRRMDMPERLEHRMDRNEVQDEERVYEAQFIAKHILARRYRKKPSELAEHDSEELKSVLNDVEKSCYEVCEWCEWFVRLSASLPVH